MKFKLILLITLFSFTKLLAQTNGINYKALIKDEIGNVLVNSNVNVQFDILATSNQTLVYSETHPTTTDANGLVVLSIGQGNTSYIFADIQWEMYEHYLNVKIDTGSGFTNMATTEFMAVPYALQTEFANSSGISSVANSLTLNNGNTNEFTLNYDTAANKLRITENGISGNVLEIKDGELYLPQYAGSNNGPLKVDTTGKVISENIPQTIIYNRFEFPIIDVYSNYTRMQKGVQFPDGTVLTGIKSLLMDNNTTGSFGVNNTVFVGLYRMNRFTYDEFGFYPIYRIDGSDTPTNQFVEFTQTNLAISGANIIDNINYIYVLQVYYCDDCSVQEVTIMKN